MILTDTHLNAKEIVIIRYICRDLPMQEIAQKLNLSLGTLAAHRRRIYVKTKTKSGVSLLKYAIRTGIVRLKDIVPISK